MTDEHNSKLVTFQSLNDLSFSTPGSMAYRYYWNRGAYLALAETICKPLVRLYDKVPLTAFLTCMEACCQAKSAQIARYKVRAVARDGCIFGVARFRSLQVVPSLMFRYLLGFPAGLVKIHYLDSSLTAEITSLDGSRTTGIRTMFQTGWSLERKPVWSGGIRGKYARFRRWRMPDWGSAIFNLKADMGIPES